MTDATTEAMLPNSPPPSAPRVRPAVPFGGALLVAGGLALLLAPYLSWYKMYNATYDGFSRDPLSTTGAHNQGWLYLAFGVAVGLCGLVQLITRRITAVAVLGVIAGVFALVVCLGFLTNAADLQSALHVPAKKFHWKPGQWVGLAGAMVALAGGVGTLARRSEAAPRSFQAVAEGA